MKLLTLTLALLVSGNLWAEKPPEHTCRILFLDGPDSAPDTLHLFDGVSSREVELPRMNFSKVYKMRAGDLNMRLLPSAVDDPAKVPSGAPSATVGANVVDFYLLVTSDPENKVAPVRMQVIDAGSDKLKPGQMLWFNLTQNTVGGVLGKERLNIKPMSRVVVDPPTAGVNDYEVNLAFRMPDKDVLYPLCETKWIHDPRSRSVAFIISEEGVRTPRVLVFPDYRDSSKEKKDDE